MPTTSTAGDAGDPRRKRMDALATKIKACRRCEGLNIPGETESAPGYGSVWSPVAIVGESLCHACMASQIPFTGGSERVLNESFKLAGITNKREVFITNTVHCHPHSHPRDNRDPLPCEIANCRSHLHDELEIVAPRLVIGLGRYAKDALRSEYPHARELPWPFRIPRTSGAGSPDMLFPPHPYWIMTRPKDIHEQYVRGLAHALKWGFRDVPARNQPRSSLR